MPKFTQSTPDPFTRLCAWKEMNLAALQLAALPVAAGGWLGTPFHAHSRVKGSGVDCVNFGIAVYAECGVVCNEAVPTYGLADWKFRVGHGPARLWLDACPQFRCIWTDEEAAPFPHAPGDCLLFRLGKSDHHVGIAVDDREFLHAVSEYGVILSNINDPTYMHRVVAVYRPVKDV